MAWARQFTAIPSVRCTSGLSVFGAAGRRSWGSDIAHARAGWEEAKRMIADPSYKMVMLDELNIVLRYDYLPLAEDQVAAHEYATELCAGLLARDGATP